MRELNNYETATLCDISHVNALNAVHRSATHGTLVDALRTRAAYAHVKAWNDGVILGIGVANAARIENKTHWYLVRSLYVATDVYAVEMRARTSRRLWTCGGRRWTHMGWLGSPRWTTASLRGCSSRSSLKKLLLRSTASRFVDVSVGRHVVFGQVPECDELRKGDGAGRARGLNHFFWLVRNF